MKRNKKLGVAFADRVVKARNSQHHVNKSSGLGKNWEDVFLPNYDPERAAENVSPWRLVIISSIFLIIFFGLFLRLFYLQILSGKSNRDLADSNRIQIKVIHAPRGVIYDRNNNVLADNNPGFRIKKSFLTRDEALKMEVQNDAKINQLEVDSIRHYPLGQIAAHVVGYVGQISEDELKTPKFAAYKLGDRIGRAGVEQVYEQVLRGTDGAEIIEVDAAGKKLRTLRTVDPIAGNDIHLALDVDIQKVAFEALKKQITTTKVCCGSAIVEHPGNGEVLAMVSIPSFDGNAFTDPKRNNEIEGYFNDPSSPLLNRAISGTYPPGSTFKITSALAGLSLQKVTEKTLIEDTGIVDIGTFHFANWYFSQYGKTEGQVNIVKALQRSNDTFFYKLGQLVGETGLGQTALKLGLGKKTGIDLPGEESGLVPDGKWKEDNTGLPWYPGDTLHMAIGQGFLLATPLQMLYQTNYIANNGSNFHPHLVTEITAGSDVVKKFNFNPESQGLFASAQIGLVRMGMEQVPKEGGTAWPFFNFTIPTAGKTGTAEFGDLKSTHAWYVSYAPASDPEISSVVMVEGGGEGSTVASPVAKDIYNWYFNPDKTHLKSLDKAPVSTSSAKLGE